MSKTTSQLKAFLDRKDPADILITPHVNSLLNQLLYREDPDCYVPHPDIVVGSTEPIPPSERLDYYGFKYIPED